MIRDRKRAKDCMDGFELRIDPFFAPFPWQEYREYAWPVIREAQREAREGALEAITYDLGAADRPGQDNPRFPHYDWIYSLCRSEIENRKISLMDPAFRDDWHCVIGIQCEIVELQEKAVKLRELMWKWRRRFEITETWA